MKLSKVFKYGVIGSLTYALSPLIQVGVVDRARITAESIITGENMFDIDAPYAIKDAALLYAVIEDGVNISDPFNFWKAKLHPKTSSYMCPEEMSRYHGAAQWAVQDNAFWLSKVTGVDAEDLLPPEGDYRREQAAAIYLDDEIKHEEQQTGRAYGGERPDVPQRSCPS